MRKTMLVAASFIISLSSATTVLADQNGKRIDYEIDQSGSIVPQSAQISSGKVFVRGAGGDANLDLIFDEKIDTLYIINHRSRSYYRIDDNVINKAASMIESLSAVAESQSGVLSDLLGTLGIASENEAVKIDVVKTDTVLTTANINCQLFQQFRNAQLSSELCIAPKAGLSELGHHYQTLEAFYLFGDRLITKAGSILENIGVQLPTLSRLGEGGLPIMAYVTAEKLKVSVTRISPSAPESGIFELPTGYTDTPIPFIG